jgi:hypothetical protein
MMSLISKWFGSCGSSRRRSTMLHDSTLPEVAPDFLTQSDEFNYITITMPDLFDDVSKTQSDEFNYITITMPDLFDDVSKTQSDETNDEITAYALELSNRILDMV